MPVTGPGGAAAMLDQLGPLCRDEDRAVLAALRERLGASRLRVLVAGEAKRGKSTLINAMLGRDVLPTGVTPLTAIPATVVHQGAGSDCGEHIEVAFANGDVRRKPLPALETFGTERGNPGNCRQVASVTVRVAAPILQRGAELVDTPGTGSVYPHNTAAADRALPTMDAAIFVLAADPPVSAAERDLLSRVAGLSVALFIVLNKADYLPAAQRARAVQFAADVAGRAAGRPARIYPMSARRALEPGGDPGFAAFLADFEAYLDRAGPADAERAVAGHARRLAAGMLDEVAVAEHAARLPADAAAEQAAAFSARLAAVAGHGRDAADRAAGHARRARAALDESAGLARSTLTADLQTGLNALLNGDLASASPASIERDGRAGLAATAAAAADAWRRRQAASLEEGLRVLAEQLTAGLETELAGVRAAALEIFGIDLTLPGPAVALQPDPRFFYDLSESVDQAELLAGALRRHLPGEIGRRAARRHVRAQAPGLADRLTGRARADLQGRLAQASRQLLAQLQAGYRQSTGRLEESLRQAAVIRADSAAAAGRQLAGLASRRAALQAVLDQLA